MAWPEVARTFVDDPDELVRRHARDILPGGPEVAARIDRHRRVVALRQPPPAFDV
jgi:hypothetical protein